MTGTAEVLEALKQTVGLNSPPGHRRTLQVRRTLAALLLAMAACSAVMSFLQRDPAIVIFTREVPAGTVLTAQDVGLQRTPQALIPEAAVIDLDAVIGRVTISAASAREPVTDSRLLGNHLVEGLSGPEAAMVPVTIAEADTIHLLHHGDTVSIVAAGASTSDHAALPPRVIAQNARVVAVSEAATGREDTILVSLSHEAALAVATASLHTPLAVVLTPRVAP